MKRLYLICFFLINSYFFLKADFVEFSNTQKHYGFLELKNREIIFFQSNSKEDVFLIIEYCKNLKSGSGIPYIIKKTEIVKLSLNQEFCLESCCLDSDEFFYITLRNNLQNNIIYFKKFTYLLGIDSKGEFYKK